MDNGREDITKDLTPTQYLGFMLAESLMQGYCKFVSRDAWRLSKKNAENYASFFRYIGLTDEVIRPTMEHYAGVKLT